MHNGITTITAGGKTYRLRFGRLAYEEFMVRQLKSVNDSSNTRRTIDLVLAGMINEADFNDEPYPTRQFVHEVCETAWTEDPATQQFTKAFEVYFASRDGSERILLDKKKEDIELGVSQEETIIEQV